MPFVSVGMPMPVRAVIGVLVGLLCLYGAVRLAIQGAWAYAVLTALAGVLSFEPACVMMRVRWERKRLAAMSAAVALIPDRNSHSDPRLSRGVGTRSPR